MTPSEWITAGSIVAGVATFILQTTFKRQDEKRAAQLARLNRQLSELYGPLYAMDQAGQRNWYVFLASYSTDTGPLHQRAFLAEANKPFLAPAAESIAEYRRRMQQLFLQTNSRMAALIARHADLVIGQKMPDEFCDFLAHAAAGKLMVDRWTSASPSSPDDLTFYHIDYPHPARFKHLVRASFEVLKQTQREVLTGETPGVKGLLHRLKIFFRGGSVDEAQMERRIRALAWKYECEWNDTEPPYVGTIEHWLEAIKPAVSTQAAGQG